MELPQKYRNSDRFSLGDNPSMANSGLRDVITKKQIATSGSFDLLNKDASSKPFEGKIEIVLDGAGQPGCAIQFWKVDTVLFNQVDEQFAKDEACKNLDEWISIHKAYFERKGCFASDMKLYRLYFNVIEVFASNKKVA